MVNGCRESPNLVHGTIRRRQTESQNPSSDRLSTAQGNVGRNLAFGHPGKLPVELLQRLLHGRVGKPARIKRCVRHFLSITSPVSAAHGMASTRAVLRQIVPPLQQLVRQLTQQCRVNIQTVRNERHSPSGNVRQTRLQPARAISQPESLNRTAQADRCSTPTRFSCPMLPSPFRHH